MSKRPFSSEVDLEGYLQSFSEQIDEAKQGYNAIEARAIKETSEKVLALKKEIFGENIGLTGETVTPTRVTNEDTVANTIISNAKETHEQNAVNAFSTFITEVNDAVPDGAGKAMGLDTFEEKLYNIAAKYDLDKSIVDKAADPDYDDESKDVDSEKSLEGEEKDQEIDEEGVETEGKDEDKEVEGEEENLETEGKEQEEETPQIELSDEQKQQIGARLNALEEDLKTALQTSHANLESETKRAETYKGQAAEFNIRQNKIDNQNARFLRGDAVKERDAHITQAVTGVYQNIAEAKSNNPEFMGEAKDRLKLMDSIYSTLTEKKIAGAVLATSIESAEKQYPLLPSNPGQAFAEQAMVGLRGNIEVMIKGLPNSTKPSIVDKILSGSAKEDIQANATSIGQFIATQVIDLKLIGAVDQQALSLKHEGLSAEKKAQIGQDIQTMGQVFLPAIKSFPDVLSARLDTVFDNIVESKTDISRNDRVLLRDKLDAIKPFMMDGAQPGIMKGREELIAKTGVEDVQSLKERFENPVKREAPKSVTPEDIKASVSGARERRESLTVDELKVSQHESQKPVTQEDIKTSINGAREKRESLTVDELKVSQHESQLPVTKQDIDRDMATFRNAKPLTTDELKVSQHESQLPVTKQDIDRDMATFRNAKPLTTDELKVSQHESQQPILERKGEVTKANPLEASQLPPLEQHQSQQPVKVQESERGNVRNTIDQLKAKFAGSTLGQEAKSIGEKLKNSGISETASSKGQTAAERLAQNNGKNNTHSR